MDEKRDANQAYELETRQHYQREKIAWEYHRQFASIWSLRNLSHVLVAKAEQRAIRRILLRIRSELSLAIDIPCGSGKLLPVFGELSVPTIAADVSSQMLAIARTVADSCTSSVHFARLDITALPFSDETFDAAICLRLLHRVPTVIKKAALRELRRVTRRYAIVSYGVETRWHSYRQRFRSLLSQKSSIPYALNPNESENLFLNAGFELLTRVTPLPLLSAEEIAVLVKSRHGGG
jgi:ubiquinone/menaquinone biosynthesis C-methylase UbiE